MFANDTFDELAAVAGGRRPKAIAGEFSECIILGTPFHTTPSYSHQFPISTPLFPIAALVNGRISPGRDRNSHACYTFPILRITALEPLTRVYDIASAVDPYMHCTTAAPTRTHTSPTRARQRRVACAEPEGPLVCNTVVELRRVTPG